MVRKIDNKWTCAVCKDIGNKETCYISCTHSNMLGITIKVSYTYANWIELGSFRAITIQVKKEKSDHSHVVQIDRMPHFFNRIAQLMYL